MNTTAYAFEQPITEQPEIPAQFGEDGGKFYHYYDQLADELDEDLTKRLKSQLDSLLIFAGLFAGVNSAFLALTLPMMSADPADDTNALLLQLVKGGNATINSEADLPSATFSPSSAIYPVNVLFAVSLTCALMSSFLAVLGQQWLVYYRKRSGGGAEHQRKEQLRRQLGAQRWRLELILDDVLPSLLQSGLVIFCVSFILYLRTLSASMSSIIAAIVGTAVAVTVAVAVCATWDRMCPYQSPLSHLLCWSVDRLKPVPIPLVWLFILLKTSLHEILWTRTRRNQQQVEASELSSVSESSSQRGELEVNYWQLAQGITSRGLARVGRREETASDLSVASIKRVILTSEHTAALIHAATNICAIHDEGSLRQLLSDTEIVDRLYDLRLGSSRDTSLRKMYEAGSKAFSAAILHLVLSVGTIMDLMPPLCQLPASNDSLRVQTTLLSMWGVVYDVRLDQHLWEGDLAQVNHLRLLGILLHTIFYDSTGGSWRVYFKKTIESLANFTTSRQLLSTLTCAVEAYRLGRQWDFEGGDIELFVQLFELAKTTYRSQGDWRNIPFLLEALELPFELRSGDYGDRLGDYEICIHVFRHACLIKHLHLPGVFASMGRLQRDIDLNIRHLWTPERVREQFRGYRDQYIRIILRGLDDYLPV
ncbi:hypothetical protein FRC01_000395, partial [Tulasnella sp. 417]